MAELKYPLGEHNRADVRSQTGKAADELTVADIRAGTITSADAAVDPDTLRRQAEFAEQGPRVDPEGDVLAADCKPVAAGTIELLHASNAGGV